MSVHPTTIKHLSRGLAVAGTIITGLALPSAASATTSNPTKVDGNPNCATLGAGFREVKIDPVPQGSTRFSGGSITVSGRIFDWSTTSGVDAVIVKGGPNANVYRFSSESTSGTGFRAPTNPSNGQPYGLSHITFCFDADGTPAPTPPASDPAPCEAGGPTTMPNGQPCEVEEPSSNPAPTPTPVTPSRPVRNEAPSSQPAPAPAPAPVTTSLASSAPQQDQTQVLGARAVVARVNAAAQMSGPRRCVTRSFRQVVSGSGIKRVVVRVNGRVVRTFAASRSRYAFRLRPTAGVLRITARVDFVKSSGKRPKTLRMTVQRCSAGNAPAQARFAG